MTIIRRTALATCAVAAGVLGWAAWMRQSSEPPPQTTTARSRPSAVAVMSVDSAVESPVPLPASDKARDVDSEEVVGIGAEVEIDGAGGALRILRVIPSSPAEKAGLSAGLTIEQIDGRTTRGLPLPECVALIRGLAGTRVRLELFDPRKSETLSVELTRVRLQH